jgi:hypothetical protein
MVTTVLIVGAELSQNSIHILFSSHQPPESSTIMALPNVYSALSAKSKADMMKPMTTLMTVLNNQTHMNVVNLVNFWGLKILNI